MIRALLIFATGLFSGICFGFAVFWSTGPADAVFWAFLGLIAGGWGWHVDRRVFG